MFYTIITILATVLLVTAIVLIIVIYSGPQLPKETNKILKAILAPNAILPELITGQTGYAKNGEVSIWYELIRNEKTTKGTILLVGGLSCTVLDWQDYTYQPFLEAGYQVIRFDNRDVGMSDWMHNWSRQNHYTLEDMAKDAVAVLDALQIQKAHVVGMSMGGMISQRIAISHSDRVLSLTSIMSTGYMHDPELKGVTSQFILNMARFIIRYRDLTKTENKIKLHLGIQRMLLGKGGYAFDNKAMMQKALYELTKRKGFNKKSRDQQGYAIKKSGSRYEELKQLNVPTLVIHGTTDPLVLFEHGQKYAPMIPNAKTLFIDGMGHDFPRVHMPKMAKAIMEFNG